MSRAIHSSDWAEHVAIAALGFLAGNAEHLSDFLALTGLQPETIREAAGDPGFKSALLDYLCADESLLLAFAANAAIAPEQIARARLVLAGPQLDGLRDG